MEREGLGMYKNEDNSLARQAEEIRSNAKQ